MIRISCWTISRTHYNHMKMMEPPLFLLLKFLNSLFSFFILIPVLTPSAPPTLSLSSHIKQTSHHHPFLSVVIVYGLTESFKIDRKKEKKVELYLDALKKMDFPWKALQKTAPRLERKKKALYN